MKKTLGIISAAYFILIPFSIVFYLLYSLISNKSVNLFNGGVVLDVAQSSFKLNISSNLVLIYIVLYIVLIVLVYIVSRTKVCKNFYEKGKRSNG